MVDTNVIDDMLDTFIDAILDAFTGIAEYFIEAIGNFAGNFMEGDLTSNTPALLALTLVLITTGGVLAYKISRG
jgi:hypothetical protein